VADFASAAGAFHSGNVSRSDRANSPLRHSAHDWRTRSAALARMPRAACSAMRHPQSRCPWPTAAGRQSPPRVPQGRLLRLCCQPPPSVGWRLPLLCLKRHGFDFLPTDARHMLHRDCALALLTDRPRSIELAGQSCRLPVGEAHSVPSDT
jgi:hypothetical protein